MFHTTMMMMPSTNPSSSRSCLLIKALLLLAAALCSSASAANNIGRIDAVADIEGVGVGADPNPTKKEVFASPTSSSAATPHGAPVIDRHRNNRDLMKKATHTVKKRKKSPVDKDPFVWPESTKSAKAAEAESETDPAAEAEVKELVDSAKTYIQLGSYDEAFDHANMAIGRIGSGHHHSDIDIRNLNILLDIAYLEVTHLRRRQLFKYKTMIAEQPAEDEIVRSLLMKQIAKVQDGIVRTSERYIHHLESRITLNTLSRKELTALYKILGDIYFIMAGVQEGVHRTISLQKAEAAYNKAVSHASDLSPTDPIRLGIASSRFIFYDALNLSERARTIAEVAVEVAAQTGLVHLPEVTQDATCSAEEASRMTSDPCTPCPLRLEEDHDDPDCCSVAKILACRMAESLHDHDYLNDEVNGEVSLSITFVVNTDRSLDLKEISYITFSQRVSGDDADIPHLSEDVFRDKLEEVMSSELEGGVAVNIRGGGGSLLYNRESREIDGVITTVIVASLVFFMKAGSATAMIIPSASESELKEGWAATPLQKSDVAWQYGVSGPFWYASGATIQVLLFGLLVESIAQNQIDPNDMTLENDFMYSVGLLHSPETHNDLRGRMYFFEIPYSMATSLGLASTALMLPITRNEAGSGLVPPAPVADNLLGGVLPNTHAATANHPVNIAFGLGLSVVCAAWGIWLTGQESSYHDNDESLQPGMINIVGNFGTVFVDQSYWQSAIVAPQNGLSQYSLYTGFAHLIAGLCCGLSGLAVGNEYGLRLIPAPPPPPWYWTGFLFLPN